MHIKVRYLSVLSVIILLNIRGIPTRGGEDAKTQENKGTTEQQKEPEERKFAAGEETRIDVNDKDIGGDHFVVYVPSDYTDEHDWPVIFFYNGVGGGPSTKLFRKITEGEGFIIIGMEYVKADKDKVTAAQYSNILKREFKSIFKAKRYVSKRLKVDNERLFLTGFSRGGWHTAALIEQNAKPWAGAAIIAAGRRGVLPSTTDGERFLRNKPIYIGTGEKDENMDAAEEAREYYRRRGADVTFEEYKGTGHMFKADSKILHDWLLINSADKRAENVQAGKRQKAD